MSCPIEDYALISDCESAALVSKQGSIDWLCLPRFDSPACFAALLGTPDHGRWKIAPAGPATQTGRRYVKDTLVLETDFQTESGAVTVVDFMPLRESNPHLIRMVRGRQGAVAMKMELSLRFDYGELVPWVTRLDDGAIRAVAGPHMVLLRTSAPLRGEDLSTVSEFTVKAGETVSFVLCHVPSHLPIPEPIDPQKELSKTLAFWKDWISGCQYEGPYAEAVKRSLLTLKGLTYFPSGGITAAATTSLPEKIGGQRNWDYRYCWLRDATLALQVLLDAGFEDEAGDWRDWLVRAVAGSPDKVQILYGLRGERHIREWELDWLPGYEDSKPVRVGNAAAEQLQLDIYGELAGVLHHARKHPALDGDPDLALEFALLEHLEKIWRQPDDGIWEVRGGRQQFTHSKVMAWFAFDSAIKSCELFGLKAPVERWRKVRQEIHDDVCSNGFDAKLGSFVQFYGASNLDASLLVMPRYGFLPPSDSRVQGTISAIERDLMEDGLVLRYRTHETDDGLPPGEGVFLPCSFWLVDAYALSGRLDDARKLFEKLLTLQNDLGLLSEEYDPRDNRQVGNFPQAFSHFALVSSAFLLGRAESSPGADAVSAAPRVDTQGSKGH